MFFDFSCNREAWALPALHNLIHVGSGHPNSSRKFALGLLGLLQKLIQSCHV
jgi:hypothetical protein